MKLRNKKTGKIGELHYQPDKEYHFTVAPEDPADMEIFKTLEELAEEWEDYEPTEPTEPLIKDEKIRKAVRAWAEAVSNSDALIEFDESAGSLWCNRSRVQFDNAELKGLENWQEYTITELCGEEA